MIDEKDDTKTYQRLPLKRRKKKKRALYRCPRLVSSQDPYPCNMTQRPHTADVKCISRVTVKQRQPTDRYRASAAGQKPVHINNLARILAWDLWLSSTNFQFNMSVIR